MKALSPFKRGDTFSLDCTNKKRRADANGAPIKVDGKYIYDPEALTNQTLIKAQLRDPVTMSLVDDLQIVFNANQTDSPGKFVMLSSVNADTGTWPLGSVICDLEVTVNGKVRSSDSFLIPIIEDVTK
ncbi:hypothetical protein [Polynucleobacter sp. AP-RePozz3-80-G7]|uniref:hypothetical protein n=1 Tax=Polynucleobacter sp. AP-RePozz3-80-G7 TaxID=2689105 RepID=UPI001C0DF1FF|nr:hypothetical protein [Polynucleobacter sp. AP-RePozz3-80-G7]MBU3640023.1 hypothetical protein [Polynucleobacter sp. AP-RePozz3-80-G7]